MKHQRAAMLLLPVVAILTAAGTAQAATASAVTANRHCSQTSLSNLQLQRENGKLSVDFGVDMAHHTAGVTWKVKATDNGTAFLNTSKRTIADGSFSITHVIPLQAGTNHIRATATNPTTGEKCVISATL